MNCWWSHFRRGNQTPAGRSRPPARALRRLESLEDRRLLTVITVDTLVDAALASSTGDGHISLREAIQAANSNTSVDGSPAGSSTAVDVIQFSSNLTGTLSLAAGALTISDTVNVQGPGAATLTISAQQLSRIFDLTGTAGAVKISGLTLANGKTTGAIDGGGAIRSFAHATLTIASSTISGSSTTGTDAPGGGVAVYSSNLILQNSTVSGNSTAGQFAYGGGVYADLGNITLQNSTVSGNTTAGLHGIGGGLCDLSGSITLQNSTLTGNTTAGTQATGGGLYAFGGATLHNSIVAGNSAPQSLGPDLRLGSGTLDAQFSLIGDNRGTTGLAESPAGGADARGNLIGGPTNGVVNPLLSALGNYGGPTRTHALLPGSPAINSGSNSLATTDAITSDQRGIARPQGSAIDLGAFESRGFTLTKVSGDLQATLAGTAFSGPLVVQVASSNGEPVQGGAVTVVLAPAASGASAMFAAGTTATLGASGQASFAPTANSLAGSYAASVVTRGAATAVSFSLSNQLQPTLSGLAGPTISLGTAAVTLSGQIAAGGSTPGGSVSITLAGVTQLAAINAQTGSFSAVFNTASLTSAASPYAITYSFAASGVYRAVSDASRRLTVSSSAAIVGRSIFYNNSAFDGNSVAASAADDAALATDKTALLPGGTATLANYTSYSRGINGIMVDIAGRPNVSLSASDFVFRVGNSSTPGQWALAPAPASISVRIGAGASGADRVTLTWADNAIQKQWLQITVNSTSATGLTLPSVFYFGNAVGEAGGTPSNALVNNTDELSARSNPRTFNNPAPITNLNDYNRDTFVNATDQILARSNGTTLTTSLKLIQPPATLSVEIAPSYSLAVAAALSSAQQAAVSTPQSIQGEQSAPKATPFAEVTSATNLSQVQTVPAGSRTRASLSAVGLLGCDLSEVSLDEALLELIGREIAAR